MIGGTCVAHAGTPIHLFTLLSYLVRIISSLLVHESKQPAPVLVQQIQQLSHTSRQLLYNYTLAKYGSTSRIDFSTTYPEGLHAAWIAIVKCMFFQLTLACIYNICF